MNGMTGGLVLGAAVACAGLTARGDHAGVKAVLGDTSADYVEVKDPVVKANIERFRDMKLGLMMHFGPYSQVGITESWPLLDPASGWERRRALHMGVGDAFRSNYWNLARTFNPIRFDADAWAEAAATNGFRYLCFTTKHHDGFAMYDTKYSDYKITAKDCPYSSRPNADMVRDIWDAFRRRGLAISCYFSKADWHHGDYWEDLGVGRRVGTLPTYDTKAHPERWARFERFMRDQMVELCRDYGRIEIMWLDCAFVGGRPETRFDLSGILAECRRYQPWLIAADRGVPGVNEQIVTPEQAVPPEPLACPWESCITMGTGWSYRYDDTYKSARELIQMFVGIVAKGGCLALNVGPRPDGVIPDPALRRMREMGAWLRANGAAIYASRPFAPHAVGNWRFTRRAGHFYAIRLTPDGERDVRQVLLDDGKSKGWKLARVVHVPTGAEIPFGRTDGGWLLRLPQGLVPDPAADAFELFFD